jgi:hypothetical protein
MKHRKSDTRPSTENLISRLSPAGRRKYLDMLVAQEFSLFVRKVFETVSPGIFR